MKKVCIIFLILLAILVCLGCEQIAGLFASNTNPVIVLAQTELHGIAGVALALDSSASYDSDGDALQTAWQIEEMPIGSEIELSDQGSSITNFSSDTPGTYRVRVFVDDGKEMVHQDITITLYDISNLSVEIGPNFANLTWELPGADLTYEAAQLLFSPDEGQVQPIDVTGATSYQVTGLSYETMYMFTLRLRVSDGSYSTGLSTSATTIDSGPIASFTWIPNPAEPGETVYFNADESFGHSLSYAWDFGDGGTGEGELATHVYSANGTYSVSLTATDEEGRTDTISQDVSVYVNYGPTADFSVNASPAEESPITFDASTSTDPNPLDTLTYSWDFGDGTIVTDISNATIEHVYQNGGSKTVTLTVSDGSLSDSYEQTISVQEVNDTPVADFTYSVSGLTASFIDQSMDEENGVSTWNWDFGEGSSDVQNPSYTFSSPGEKTVTLTVTDSGGATSEPVSNSFMVYAPPVAGNGGAISVVSISESSISVSWDSATDADDNPSDLTYTVYYSSRLTDLQGTLSEIQARASIGPSDQAIDQGVISSLDPNTQYYFTVVVQDPGGLYDAYTISNATTLTNSSFIIAGDFSSYNGTRSIFVARYEITNEQIRLVSSGVYDTLENDYAEDVTVDGSGNVFVVGYRHNGTDEDALIVRFTSALGMPSGVSFDVRDDDRFNSVEYSGSYVYAAGIGAFNGTTSQGIVYQIEPLSLSVAASINGLNIMGQSSEMQICEWIQADSIGNLFVCGYENAGEGDQWVVWKISSEFKEINEHNFGDIGITGRAQAGDIRNDLWYAAGTYPDNTGAGAVSPVNFLTGYMDPGLIVSDVFASTEETEVTGICIDEFGGLVVTGCLGNLSTTWTASIVHPDTLSSLDLSQFNSSTLYGSPEDALSIDAERTIIIGPETSLSTVRSCIILLDNSGSSTVLSVPIGDVINMGQYETGSGNGLFMRALCKE